MSMPTMRRAIGRRKATIARCAASMALFATASLVVASTATHPSPVVVRPAALALSTPVSITHNAPPPLREVALDTAASTWDLANIANPRVDTWERKFSSTLKTDFAATMSRGRAYSDMISEKLEEREMPQELIYLAMIESEFKPAVRSRVSAVGLWQFMAGTARHFGLTVSRHADERTNPAKATDAALTYLSELHDHFGSWYLAAAAYNAGEGRVSRALRRQTGRTKGSDADFYRIAPALPAETRDYVPKLIAAARVGKAAGDF